MKKYLAMFLGSPKSMGAWKDLDEVTRKAKETEGMQAWMKWVEDNKDSIVDMGSPLGKTKRVTKDGITDVRNEMGAWIVVQAESQEDAAKLFLNHPHFMIFPGEAAEIMECLPMPTVG